MLGSAASIASRLEPVASGEWRVARELLSWFGQSLLTRPSSSTTGYPVSDRWRVTSGRPNGHCSLSTTSVNRTAIPTR